VREAQSARHKAELVGSQLVDQTLSWEPCRAKVDSRLLNFPETKQDRFSAHALLFEPRDDIGSIHVAHLVTFEQVYQSGHERNHLQPSFLFLRCQLQPFFLSPDVLFNGTHKPSRKSRLTLVVFFSIYWEKNPRLRQLILSFRD
jgi:hypothetical protein